ncbi:hypothetical protein BCAR13_310056 [Paraburkholderia caribensis]|nr:hypothetical protein BCAR13_310056 [Paraburkholderia caribensis]
MPCGCTCVAVFAFRLTARMLKQPAALTIDTPQWRRGCRGAVASQTTHRSSVTI